MLLPLLTLTALVSSAKCFDIVEYTAMTGSVEKCYSKCDFYYNKGYYFCYVDEKQNWDYCSPKQYDRPVLKKPFTLSYGPCTDDCTWNSYYQGYKCNTYFFIGLYDCEPQIYEYVKSYTYTGEECAGSCDKHEGYTHYWCYNSKREHKYCSPYRLSDLDEVLSREIKKITHCSQNTCGSVRSKRQVPYCAADSRTPGSVMLYAASLIALGNVGRLITSQSSTNPIYRYAYLTPSQPNGPAIPLMISARITNNSLPLPGSRQSSSIPSNVITNVNRMNRHTNRPDGNNDDNGHLIAFENGGPNVVYNFIPQPRSLNRGIATGVPEVRQSEWRRAEDSINEWVRNGEGHVEQTVVVMYDNYQTNPRPVGIAQHVTFFRNNGTVRYECDDFYSNDPSDPPIIHDELKKRSLN